MSLKIRQVLPHTKVLLTKIVHLSRHMSLSPGNVVLQETKKNRAIKFVAYFAAMLASKNLFIVNTKDELSKIVLENNIGTIILGGGTIQFMPYHRAILVLSINQSTLFSMEEDFHFLQVIVHKMTIKGEINALKNSSFKFSLDSTNGKLRRVGFYNESTLILKQDGSFIRYPIKYILKMLNVVDSEFGIEPFLYVNFKEISFEQSFVYMLYFFLRGDLLDMYTRSIIPSELLLYEKPVKRMIFQDAEHFDKDFHSHHKYKLFSRLNSFLNKWKLTRWITRFTYDHILRAYGQSRRDEIILINPTRSHDRATLIDRARTKVSIIFGTPADMYTLGINRYDDKDVNLTDYSFKVMDSDSTIKLQKDAINRLFIGGSRIPFKLKNTCAIQSKKSSDKYYVSDYYCDIEGEILTIKADMTDIYYDREGNIAVDIGTRIRSLLSIPYIKHVDVFKIKGTLVLVADLDKEFIKLTYETPSLMRVTSHLREAVQEINSLYGESQRISHIIVSNKFFNTMEDVKSIISKKNFIRYLDQQPSHYFERLLKEEVVIKDRDV